MTSLAPPALMLMLVVSLMLMGMKARTVLLSMTMTIHRY
jgi:hypothetical protein